MTGHRKIAALRFCVVTFAAAAALAVEPGQGDGATWADRTLAVRQATPI